MRFSAPAAARNTLPSPERQSRDLPEKKRCGDWRACIKGRDIRGQRGRALSHFEHVL